MWNWFLAQVGIFDSTLAFMSSLFSVTQFLGFFFFFFFFFLITKG